MKGKQKKKCEQFVADSVLPAKRTAKNSKQSANADPEKDSESINKRKYVLGFHNHCYRSY